MARDIYVKPEIGLEGLLGDYRAVRKAPTQLEAILGAATGIPMGLAAGRRAQEDRAMQMREMQEKFLTGQVGRQETEAHTKLLEEQKKQLGIPQTFFNPMTGTFVTAPSPKAKAAMTPFLRPQYRTVGDAVVKITPTPDGGEQVSELGLSPQAISKARTDAMQFNAAIDSLGRISALAGKIYTTSKPEDLADIGAIFKMFKQGFKVKAERLAKSNTDVVQLAKAMNAFISLDVKALGDTGNLAYQDIERVKAAMPTDWENVESATSGINIIRDVLESAADRKLASYAKPMTRENIAEFRIGADKKFPAAPLAPTPDIALTGDDAARLAELRTKFRKRK